MLIWVDYDEFSGSQSDSRWRAEAILVGRGKNEAKHPTLGPGGIDDPYVIALEREGTCLRRSLFFRRPPLSQRLSLRTPLVRLRGGGVSAPDSIWSARVLFPGVVFESGVGRVSTPHVPGCSRLARRWLLHVHLRRWRMVPVVIAETNADPTRRATVMRLGRNRRPSTRWWQRRR